MGRAFKRAREDAGLEQEEAAKRLGIHPMTLSRYERGVRPIPVGLFAVADKLYGSRLSQRPAEAAQPQAAPHPPPGAHAPSYWQGTMEATLRTLLSIAALTDAATTNVRGLVESGALLGASPADTLLPPVSPEERRAAEERAQAILDRKQREAQTHEPPAPPKSAGGRKRGA